MRPGSGWRMTNALLSAVSQAAMQAVAGCPIDDLASEQIDDDGKVQPSFPRPDV